MPSRNSTKLYVENGYYHIYNRGVEKRIIFLDQQDFSVFLNYLKDYLLPKDKESLQTILSSPITSSKEKAQALKLLRLNNFSDEITLLAYCLMPNHFHLLIKQKNSGTIDKFMNSLATRYTMYFNQKYKRVGPLYQDVYKAVLVNTDEQLLHLTRYIHKQALALKGDAFQSSEVTPCSYLDYIQRRKTEWVHPEEVLAYFSATIPNLSYQAFVAETDEFGPIEDIILEE